MEPFFSENRRPAKHEEEKKQEKRNRKQMSREEKTKCKEKKQARERKRKTHGRGKEGTAKKEQAQRGRVREDLKEKLVPQLEQFHAETGHWKTYHACYLFGSNYFSKSKEAQCEKFAQLEKHRGTHK